MKKCKLQRLTPELVLYGGSTIGIINNVVLLRDRLRALLGFGSVYNIQYYIFGFKRTVKRFETRAFRFVFKCPKTQAVLMRFEKKMTGINNI